MSHSRQSILKISAVKLKLIITAYSGTQTALNYSKLTIEILEQGVKYFKVNNKDTRST